MILGPLTYVGFAGCLALGALAGIQTIKANHAERQRDHERATYASNAAQAAEARAETEAKYRQRERDMQADVEALRIHIDEATAALATSNTRADASARKLRESELSYVAAQSSRTSADPASSADTNAGTITLLGELHIESDRFAQYAAGEADRLAAQLMLLQHYVRDECHN